MGQRGDFEGAALIARVRKARRGGCLRRSAAKVVEGLPSVPGFQPLERDVGFLGSPQRFPNANGSADLGLLPVPR